MKVFLLELNSKCTRPTYDTVEALVVVSETEERARKLAALCSSAEGTEAWLNSQFSDCELIAESAVNGKERVICTDYIEP